MKNLENNFEYPQTGTAKRAISGSLVTVLGEGIGAIKHILLVPLFLWAWGKLVYGEWLTIYALVAYLPLIDLGYEVKKISTAPKGKFPGLSKGPTVKEKMFNKLRFPLDVTNAEKIIRNSKET